MTTTPSGSASLRVALFGRSSASSTCDSARGGFGGGWKETALVEEEDA